MNAKGTSGQELNSSFLREEWLNFFLTCAKEVAPQFKIGRPKMNYAPVQTENGRRNLVSVRCNEEGVKFSFHLSQNSGFEESLRAENLRFKYEPGPRHLKVFVSTPPDSVIGPILRPLAMQAAREALPNPIGQRTRNY
jgi:hypothetical protein